MATDKLVDFDHVTDYISRQAALNAVCSDDCEDCPDGGCGLYRQIKKIPAAKVEPVKKGTRAELLAAFALIRDECRKHDTTCGDCPIYDYCHSGRYGSIYDDPPCYWPDGKEATP